MLRANIVLKQLLRVEFLNVEIDGYVLIQGKPTHNQIQTFLYDTQQNLKKLENVFYPQILKELDFDPSLVSNTYAKHIHRSLKSKAAPPSSSSFVADKPTTEKSIDQNPPQRTIDRQLSNPKPSNPSKKNAEKRTFCHQRRRRRQ